MKQKIIDIAWVIGVLLFYGIALYLLGLEFGLE